MEDLATALALVLVIEGVLWALFADAMKRVLAVALGQRSSSLRMGGLAAVAVGVVLVWILRGS